MAVTVSTETLSVHIVHHYRPHTVLLCRRQWRSDITSNTLTLNNSGILAHLKQTLNLRVRPARGLVLAAFSRPVDTRRTCLFWDLGPAHPAAPANQLPRCLDKLGEPRCILGINDVTWAILDKLLSALAQFELPR